MTISESTRHQLHEALIASLGAEEAATLMEHLPPLGWVDLATKTDIDHLRIDTKAEFASVRAETKAEFASVRAETKAEFASVRSAIDLSEARLRHEIGSLRTEIADKFTAAQTATTRAMFGFTALSTTVLGLLIGYFG